MWDTVAVSHIEDDVGTGGDDVDGATSRVPLGGLARPLRPQTERRFKSRHVRLNSDAAADRLDRVGHRRRLRVRLIGENGRHRKRYKPADPVVHDAQSPLATFFNFAKL